MRDAIRWFKCKLKPPNKKKSTLKDLEKLAGFLNFLSRAIVPGQTFTRRMYTKFTGLDKLKPHHHIKLDKEFKEDCKIWLDCINNQQLRGICRPWVDWTLNEGATNIPSYTDASGSKADRGLGCFYKNSWAAEKWDSTFMHNEEPSIEFLELFALTAGLLMWSKDKSIANHRVRIYCDNMSVLSMINNLSSSCKNCMFLLRKIVKDQLVINYRVFANHIRLEDNDLADALSRGQYDRFWMTEI